MTVRFYSSVAAETTLSGSISPANTSMQVGSVSGLPIQYPYVMAVDYESATEELVEVTAAAGTTLSINRAYDGTSAASHNVGARVRHVSSAQDFRDSRDHENATAGVHGVTGNVVGDTDTQTLTNKTLNSPTISGAAMSGTISGSPTFSGAPIFSGSPDFTGNPDFIGAAVSTDVLSTRVTGDANARLAIDADGAHNWGSGSGAPDTNIYRESASVLATQAVFRSIRPGPSDNAISIRTATDTTASHMLISSDGTVNWGPGGTTSVDTNLFRDSADVLRTNDDLTVDGELVVSGGTDITGPGGGAITETIQKAVGQTGDLTSYELGGDVLARVNSFGESNWAVEQVNSGLATASAGWTLAYQQAAIKAGIITMSIGFTRTGGTITAGATGDIADTSFCTIAASYRPDVALSGNSMWFTYSTGAAGGSSELNPVSGIFTINTLNGGASIVNTNQIRMTVSWPIAGP